MSSNKGHHKSKQGWINQYPNQNLEINRKRDFLASIIFGLMSPIGTIVVFTLTGACHHGFSYDWKPVIK